MSIQFLSQPTAIKKFTSFNIWAFGVGSVISGMSFGWNNGWQILGIKGFFIPFAIVAVLYFCITKLLIELTSQYPNAEGPQDFARSAFGTTFEDIVYVVTFIDFAFCTPAIANAIGQYLSFLAPVIFNAHITAILICILFSLINYFSIESTIKFITILTCIALLEILIFTFSVEPQFNIKNLIQSTPNAITLKNIMHAMPFAIWMFLGIESINLVSNTILEKNFHNHLKKGYLYSFYTLLFLGLLILVAAGSVIHWDKTNWLTMTINNDHPLPNVLKLALGKDNILVSIFTFLGLGGLIASLQGCSLVAIKQSSFLLRPFISNSLRNKKWGVGINIFIGVFAILLNTTEIIIEISIIGAVSLYLCIGISLLRIKIKMVKNSENQSYKQILFSKAFIYCFLTITIATLCLLALILRHYIYFIFFVLIVILYIFIKSQKNKQKVAHFNLK
ncbi:MAG: hypothetical protein QM539_06945 [Alphaproteobacteria bacterium]|nr:hypothetical protein [Alphaproteobacteria bacterium]